MKPNIVVILSDQQRWDTLGNAQVWPGITPNLDRLGEDGTLFENCFSIQPVCGPARACLQSGRYATETGNYKNGCIFPEQCDSVAKYVKDAGYDTAYIGKWHLYEENVGKEPEGYDVPIANRAGYDFWQAANVLEWTSHAYDGFLYDTDNTKIEIEGYRADFITDLARKYIQNHSSEKPFYLFLSFLEPHHQNDRHCFTGPDGCREAYSDFSVPEDLKGKDGDYMENLPDYLGMCSNLDSNVGRIEQTLKEKGLWDNTLLLYSSDHGCPFRTRNSEYKRSCHEASIHVPLVAHGPGFEKKENCSHLVTLLDIPATVLHAAGVPLPASYRGVPLQEASFKKQDNVFVQISEDLIGRCLRTEKWKYCVVYDNDEGYEKPASDIYYEAFLYDLENDPHENRNLVQDPACAEVRESLKKQLLDKIWEVEHAKPEIRPL